MPFFGMGGIELTDLAAGFGGVGGSCVAGFAAGAEATGAAFEAEPASSASFFSAQSGFGSLFFGMGGIPPAAGFGFAVTCAPPATLCSGGFAPPAKESCAALKAKSAPVPSSDGRRTCFAGDTTFTSSFGAAIDADAAAC